MGSLGQVKLALALDSSHNVPSAFLQYLDAISAIAQDVKTNAVSGKPDVSKEFNQLFYLLKECVNRSEALAQTEIIPNYPTHAPVLIRSASTAPPTTTGSSTPPHAASNQQQHAQRAAEMRANAALLAARHASVKDKKNSGANLWAARYIAETTAIAKSLEDRIAAEAQARAIPQKPAPASITAPTSSAAPSKSSNPLDIAISVERGFQDAKRGLKRFFAGRQDKWENFVEDTFRYEDNPQHLKDQDSEFQKRLVSLLHTHATLSANRPEVVLTPMSPGSSMMTQEITPEYEKFEASLKEIGTQISDLIEHVVSTWAEDCDHALHKSISSFHQEIKSLKPQSPSPSSQTVTTATNNSANPTSGTPSSSLLAYDIRAFTGKLCTAVCKGPMVASAWKEVKENIPTADVELMESIVTEYFLARLQSCVLSHVYEALLATYKQECQEKDSKFNTQSILHQSVSPEAIGVPQELASSAGLISAAEVMKGLPCATSCEAKLKTLLHAMRMIGSGGHQVGADDMLPAMVYAVLQSGMKDIWSEVKFMEDFTDESLLCGGEGYVLASFGTIADFITNHMKESLAERERLAGLSPNQSVDDCFSTSSDDYLN